MRASDASWTVDGDGTTEAVRHAIQATAEGESLDERAIEDHSNAERGFGLRAAGGILVAAYAALVARSQRGQPAFHWAIARRFENRPSHAKRDDPQESA
jgi:hypothetical protein